MQLSPRQGKLLSVAFAVTTCGLSALLAPAALLPYQLDWLRWLGAVACIVAMLGVLARGFVSDKALHRSAALGTIALVCLIVVQIGWIYDVGSHANIDHPRFLVGFGSPDIPENVKNDFLGVMDNTPALINKMGWQNIRVYWGWKYTFLSILYSLLYLAISLNVVFVVCGYVGRYVGQPQPSSGNPASTKTHVVGGQPGTANVAVEARKLVQRNDGLAQYDVFISHASEDKADVARPLADILQSNGMSVWLDEFELNIGDSLREKIDLGLSLSRFGVVVLSPNFFEKQWPKHELNAMFALEEDAQKNIILPVWHCIEKREVQRFSPILADRLAANTEQGLNAVAQGIEKVVRKMA